MRLLRICVYEIARGVNSALQTIGQIPTDFLESIQVKIANYNLAAIQFIPPCANSDHVEAPPNGVALFLHHILCDVTTDCIMENFMKVMNFTSHILHPPPAAEGP